MISCAATKKHAFTDQHLSGMGTRRTLAQEDARVSVPLFPPRMSRLDAKDDEIGEAYQLAYLPKNAAGLPSIAAGAPHRMLHRVSDVDLSLFDQMYLAA